MGQKGIKGAPQIKNIIAVASGKGGVGKSTVMKSALGLVAEGARVGILDADIAGQRPQPLMLGATKKPVIEEKKIFPVICHGLQSMSMGYLVAENAAIVWRGPMISIKRCSNYLTIPSGITWIIW